MSERIWLVGGDDLDEMLDNEWVICQPSPISSSKQGRSAMVLAPNTISSGPCTLLGSGIGSELSPCTFSIFHAPGSMFKIEEKLLDDDPTRR